MKDIGWRDYAAFCDHYGYGDTEVDEGVCQHCNELADECPECGEYYCEPCGISDCRCEDEDDGSDAFGLYHDRVHKDIGRGRAAKTVRTERGISDCRREEE